MSMINLFLQKRRMHESQHGIIMVVVAYALSVMMLILGSDVFYNIKSAAAGISTINEETQEKINGEVPDLQDADLTALLIQSKLQSPFGIAEMNETGLGSIQAQNIANVTEMKETSASADSIWLLGNAMNQEEYAGLIEQIPNINSVSTVVPTTIPMPSTKGSDEAADKEEIHSLATEETVSPYVMDVTDEEISMLERIVQAEAGGEDMVGKILIVNVILNRIEDDKFPDSVEDVIFQNKNGEYQFSPVDDKSYWSVKISDKTKDAVIRALEGEDHSEGALYFIARKRTSSSSAAWFDNNLKWLFKHGGHEFYK
ncbi:MAG: putative rane protein [Firmicutes bacterium]|nr:putative rane protein [Bacillota bacterium]